MTIKDVRKRYNELCEGFAEKNLGMQLAQQNVINNFTHNLLKSNRRLNKHTSVICEMNRMSSDCNSSSDNLHHRGQIDVIEMQGESACPYKYFFAYEDQISKYIVLKALRCNTAKDVAIKLIDVLTIIGAPQVLQSSNGREFAEEVVRELRVLWEDLLILDGNTTDNKNNARELKRLLHEWLQRNPTKTWFEGLKFVQVLKNTTAHPSNNKVPCDIFFGRNVQEQFQRLTIETDLKRTMCLEIGNADRNSYKNVNFFKEENVEKEGQIPGLSSEANNCVNRQKGYNDVQRDCQEISADLQIFNFSNVKSETSPSRKAGDVEFGDVTVVKATGELDANNSELKCKICQKQYMKQGHLKNHMKTHTKGKKFECTVCSKTFHVLSLYGKHMRQCHHKRKSSILSKTRQNRNTSLNTSQDNTINEKDQSEEASVSQDTSQKDSETESIDNFSKSTKDSPSKKKCSSENRSSKVNGDSSLQCTYCKQSFSFPSVLKRHMRSHTNERPYICEVCNKSFKQLGHLSQHSLTHKDYRSFQCTVCGIKFESLDALKTHSQTHKGESISKSKVAFRLFECDNCKKVFTTKSVLERHIFTHTHERQFGCNICGKRFKQAGHVKSHMLVHTGERKFECTVCSKRFSLSNSLKKHMYVHNGEKPYQCDVCGARFLEKRNLNGHLMTHTNERPFRCKICGKRYTLADTLRRHISAAHEDGRTYQCEICAKMFKQLAHLSVHKKVHNDERPFQCHLCEKTFKHKNVLKSHLAIHANVRPFECDVCKATFVRKTNLQTHIASAHMNERPYACTICGKRFKQISHLNGHVVVHSNSMPYQCDFCDRRCNRLDNLKKHMRLHTKNKE